VRTPSQTVGPYLALGLARGPQHELPGGAVRLSGQVLDGDGVPIDDALLELWDPAHGFGRCPSDAEGRFTFLVPDAARRFELLVFARGLLKPVLTRVHLDGQRAADATQVAERDGDGFRFDVRLQGERGTAFYEL
jgi:protocatechuate 3,4-dioxygenase, alpha subunit